MTDSTGGAVCLFCDVYRKRTVQLYPLLLETALNLKKFTSFGPDNQNSELEDVGGEKLQCWVNPLSH